MTYMDSSKKINGTLLSLTFPGSRHACLYSYSYTPWKGWAGSAWTLWARHVSCREEARRGVWIRPICNNQSIRVLKRRSPTRDMNLGLYATINPFSRPPAYFSACFIRICNLNASTILLHILKWARRTAQFIK